MARKKKKQIKRVCDKCGKPQPIIKEESNENWNVYAPRMKCECGGNFKFMVVSI